MWMKPGLEAVDNSGHGSTLLTLCSMAPKKGPVPKKPDERPVNARGVMYQAEKLTGVRAQRGNVAGGKPRWTYEVKCGIRARRRHSNPPTVS